MRDELLKLHRRIKKTTVYVTHDQVEAMTMADRIVVLRGGIIQQIGKPREVYMQPNNLFVATFIGSPQMNIVHGTMEQKNGEGIFSGPFEMNLGGRFAPPEKKQVVSIGIRPEDIAVEHNRDTQAIPGEITLVEEIGSDTLISVDISDDVSCKVRVPAAFQVHERDRVKLRIPPEKIHLFDGEGSRIAAKEE
jgi:ABC-type sugar transport system ATPase subunit